MGLNPEQSRKLIELLRDYVRLQAEIRALASILETAVVINEVPVGWLDLLKKARQEEAYRSIAEQYKPLFARVDAAADATEVEQLLRTIPSARILNY